VAELGSAAHQRWHDRLQTELHKTHTQPSTHTHVFDFWNCLTCFFTVITIWKVNVSHADKQPELTVIIQLLWCTLFWHIMRMDDNTDAKRILLVPPLADWRRQPGRPHIMRLHTVQQDLKQHNLTLPEAADLAQNHPLWRMMSTYGTTQS